MRRGATRCRLGALLPVVLLILPLVAACVVEESPVQPLFSHGGIIPLPEPTRAGEMSVEEAIAGRRSVREFRSTLLDFSDLGQVLWAAQGITQGSPAPGEGTPTPGLRAAPSAGALYPLEVYVVDGRVRGLPAGVYHYMPAEHALEQILQGDEREDLWRAAGEQDAVRDAPVTLVIAALYERTTARYGERGRQYVHMEAGHAAQNVYLQCEALGLATVAIGALDEEAVRDALGLAEEETPLYLMPVGRPEETSTGEGE
jgi:SagB-type dehydrogenase family enzyme